MRFRKVRENFARASFVHHVLEDSSSTFFSSDNANQVSNVAKRNIKERFLRWLSIEKARADYISSITNNSANSDIALARVWQYLFHECQPYAELNVSKTRQISNGLSVDCQQHVVEINEWLVAAEQHGLLNFYLGHYGQYEYQKALAEEKCRMGTGRARYSKTKISLSNFARAHIRHIIEDGQNLVFNELWSTSNKVLTPRAIREQIVAQIAEFDRRLKQRLKNIPDRRSKLFEVALCQECTKAAYASVKSYISALNRISGMILIDCWVMNEKLVVPVRQVIDELEVPLGELTRIEWIRLSSEDLEDWADLIHSVVEKQLKLDTFHKNPLFSPYLKFIYDYQLSATMTEEDLVTWLKECMLVMLKLQFCPQFLPHHGFCLNLMQVWRFVKETAQRYIQECSRRLKLAFHESILQLQQQFIQFKRILNFRSMESSLMILNKSDVKRYLEHDIPEAVECLSSLYSRMHHLTQVVSLEAADHELLISTVAMRRALPKQIADHEMFFQRRAHIFASFVKGRQNAVQAQVQKSTDQLRQINTFTNPGAVTTYMEEMTRLRPLLVSIVQELKELNEFELVVGFPVTRIPALLLMDKQIDALSQLFECTNEFQSQQKTLYNRNRIDADIQEFRVYVEEFFATLSDLSTQLEGHRAARHFTIQVRAEAEKLQQSFGVIEVLSCNRLKEWHWAKMSEIVGFNLADYAESTVAQVAELEIHRHLARLKPIVYIAEREGVVSDQTNFIVNYWNKAHFGLEESALWKLTLPTNLELLISTASNHLLKLKSFYEPDKPETTTYWNDLKKWIGDLSTLHELLSKWDRLLQLWKKVAPVLRHSHTKLPKELASFRKCAKYWKRFGEEIRLEPQVIKILNEKHAECWLRLAEQHLNETVLGLTAHFDKVRLMSARLALISDGDMILLMSSIPQEKCLRIVRRACFPLLYNLYVNHKKQICVTNANGENVCLGAWLTSENLSKNGPFLFVCELAEAINLRIVDDVKRSRNQDDPLKQPQMKISKMILEAIENGIPDSLFKYQMREGSLMLQVKGTDREVSLLLDFFPVEQSLAVLSSDLVYNWSSGKVVLLVGSRLMCRLVIRRMAQNMCTPVHIINSSRNLFANVVSRCAKAARQNSVLFAFEHVDQLAPEFFAQLLVAIAGLQTTTCPRLILTSTTMISDVQALHRSNVYLQLLSSEREETFHRLTLSPTHSDSLSVTTPQGRAGSRRKSTPKPMSVLESLQYLVWGADRSEKAVAIDFACIGPFAKDTVTQMMSEMQVSATWVYFDAFTQEQLVNNITNFGQLPRGYLIQCLKHAWIESHQPQGEPLEKPGSASKQKTQCIILYGNLLFECHFSFLSSLVSTSTIAATQWPSSFLTLYDGSNFTVAPDVQFVFCSANQQREVTDALSRYNVETLVMADRLAKPASDYWQTQKGAFLDLLKRVEFFEVAVNAFEHIVLPVVQKLSFNAWLEVADMCQLVFDDLAEVVQFVTLANCGELVRWTACSSALNYLLVYLSDATSTFDSAVIDTVKKADRFIIDGGKLPDGVSQFKLSSNTFARWVRWEEEVNVPSYLNKELSINDLYVTVPHFDRLLTFTQRQFIGYHRNLIISGPPCCGKSAFVKRFMQHVNTINDQFIFYSFSAIDRFSLARIQEKFAAIMEASVEAKFTTIIIDAFRYDEAICSLIELFMDMRYYVSNGYPIQSQNQVQIILIMNETEMNKCTEKRIFAGKFVHIPLPAPNKDYICTVVEHLIITHFQAQSFSAEYIAIAGALASASLKAFSTVGLVPKRLLYPAIRLAKGLMFSLPENAPDIDSILRIFIHELTRVAIDRNHRKKARSAFFTRLESILKDECGTSLATLFPIKADSVDDDGSEFYLVKKTETIYAPPGFTVDKLLFSELSSVDQAEGISYNMVLDLVDFNRVMENLLFEYTRNHECWQLNLAITDYIINHCLRIMRVCRQAGEHVALAGRSGSGRYACIRLSNFGIIGRIFHVFVETGSAVAFEESWKCVMRECVLTLAATNQPLSVVFHFDHVAKSIPASWLGSLKLWLQNPTMDDVLPEPTIFKLAESIVDSERSLATLMQSSNLRLPGQRYCHFVSLEVLKDIKYLKQILTARVVDFLHAIFLIPIDALNLFEWCTADVFLPLTPEEMLDMGRKILCECPNVDQHTFDVLKHVFDSHLDSNEQHLARSSETRMWFCFCQSIVTVYNARANVINEVFGLLRGSLATVLRIRHLSTTASDRSLKQLHTELEDNELTLLMRRRHLNEDNITLEAVDKHVVENETKRNEIEGEIVQLQGKIDAVMNDLQKEFLTATEQLSEYSANDFRKLASVSKPNMVVRYSIEILRRLLDPTFQPKRISLDTWTMLQTYLNQRNLMETIRLFNPYTLTATHLKIMKQCCENREMRISKLETECKIAAVICKWVVAAVDLAEGNATVMDERSQVNAAWSQLYQEKRKIEELVVERQRLTGTVKALQAAVEELESEISKVRKTINYRTRGSKISQLFSAFEARWTHQVHINEISQKSLLGNAIFEAAFRSLALTETTENRQLYCAKWSSILHRANIAFDQRFCTPSNLICHILTNVDSQNPFPLVFDKAGSVISFLKLTLENVVCLEITNWLDQQLLNEVQRAIHAKAPLVIYNVTENPPAEWYALLAREPERESRVVHLAKRVCRFGRRTAVVFVTQKPKDSFSPQFIDEVTPVIVHEKIQATEMVKPQQQFSTTERNLLRLLTEYAGSDILESQETTEQLLFAGERFAASLKQY